MIIFHEGLPGSGKSYEAVVKHIIPALKQGRKIDTNINGLNPQKLSEFVEKSPEEIEALIKFFDDDEVRELWKHVRTDSLIALDELQDYFPAGVSKWHTDLISFVSRHRHKGHDIVCMGQSFADVAPLWRRRTQRKITFFKRDVVGQPTKYTWIAYAAKKPEEFHKIKDGGGEYETKYFGTYKSHEDGTDNKALNYEDDRTNIFKDKSFFIKIGGAACGCIFAVGYLYSFFSDPTAMAAQQEPIEVEQPKQTIQPVQQQTKQVQIAQAEPLEPEPIDYLDNIANRYKLRLSAAIYDATTNEIIHALIDALDSTHRLHERFTLSDIAALGWSIEQKDYGLDFIKQGTRHIARPYPTHDTLANVSANTRAQLQTPQ
jgi:zona occludens toxin